MAQLPSEATNMRQTLAQLPEIEKWGWVIYRCTYTDDATWAKFRDLVEAHSRESIAESEAPEIAKQMEWVWIEDAYTLDGASTEALREKFRAWRANEVARQPGDYEPNVIPRFRYFFKIDQEALDSLTESLSRETLWYMFGSDKTAFVKFVDGLWEPESEPLSEQYGELDYELEGEVFESIEGCTERDVGWMCVAPDMIGYSFYDALSGDENMWHIFYRRPHYIVRY